MALKTKTITNAVHRTTITSDAPAKGDGGRSLLLETFQLIRSHAQVGTLTVQFGLGGSIRDITFEEKEVIPQRSIEIDSEDISGQIPN